MEDPEELIQIEICNHCGKEVSRGSEKFINRIPDFNDILTRINNNLIFPIGDFVCEECDNSSFLK
jgi:hypothetical protein